MLVEEVMTSPPCCIEADRTVEQALGTMHSSGYRRLPVVDAGGCLVGLLSRALAEANSPECSVGEIMVTDVASCCRDLPVVEAAALLRHRRVGCLPVVADRRPVGLITAADLLAGLVAKEETPEPHMLPEPADEASAGAVRIGNWIQVHDRFAARLGIRLEAVERGYCRASMRVSRDLLNAVDTTHGGATFTLADFAFAVAANSHGQTTVGLSTSMSYPAASRAGDTLIAVASEASRGGRTGVYTVRITTEAGTLVGLFTGTVYALKDPLSEFMARKPG